MLDGGSCSCHSRASATPVLPPFHASLASFLQLRLTPRMRCALHNLLASCVAYASYGGGPLVSCLGGLFASPPRIASDPGSRCYLFEIFCGRRRDGRRCDEQTGGGGGIVARSTAPCVAPRWGREGRAAAACVRRWRGARPQTRRRSVAEPRAPRRPSCARASGCARAVCVSPVCVISYARLWPARCGGRADRRAASAERPPRVFFASGCCMRASAYKIGRTGRGLALKCNTQYTPAATRSPTPGTHRDSCSPHAACCY